MAKTIMVVDDEPDILQSVETVLKKEGYEVVTAKNGDQCLEKLEKEKPDLILLDIMMPGTPVKEVIKKIKDTKIAFLTAVKTSDAEKEELMENKNIVDFIEKPFDLEELVKKVRKLTS
ncbi:response regulator [Candidatus Woesearchaeota archaeon]|nr:response regulator [Candidatus Woesearchaeota archaeon]